MGAVDEITRQATILANPLNKKYKDMIDRDSAYEFLARKKIEEDELRQKQKNNKLLWLSREYTRVIFELTQAIPFRARLINNIAK